MNQPIAAFIRVKHIDSFQKLRLILFLHQHPELTGTCQEFAAQLYLGDMPLMEGLITDLNAAGLVDYVENRYKLNDNPDVSSSLQRLTKAYEDPLIRQSILDQVRHVKLWKQ